MLFVETRRGPLTQRWAPAQASSEWAGDTTLADETVRAAFTSEKQVLCRGCGGFDQVCRLWPGRQVERLCSLLLRQQREEYERRQMWIAAPPPPILGELRIPRQHSSPLFLVNYRIPILTHTSSLVPPFLCSPLLIHPSSGAVPLRSSSQLPSAFVHTN